MLEQTNSNKEHQLQMVNRKKIRLTGVTEVISFDPEEVLLDTSEGRLRICGAHMQVKRFELERGEVEVEGKVREILYKDAKVKRSGSVLSRMLS